MYFQNLIFLPFVCQASESLFCRLHPKLSIVGDNVNNFLENVKSEKMFFFRKFPFLGKLSPKVVLTNLAVFSMKVTNIVKKVSFWKI
jgi:hypothetical protein